MSLLLAAALLALLVTAWVTQPLFFRRWGTLSDPVASAALDREARKRVALAALKDVEYDHAAGKLDAADYEEMRSLLEMEALEALRAAELTQSDAPPDLHTCGFPNPPGSRFCAGCGQRLP